jgi:uncharacterized protein YukE
VGFRVQPEYVSKYAEVIRAQGGHAGRARDYADKNMAMSWPDQGLLNYWWGPHDLLQKAAAKHMDDLSRVCDASQRQLAEAATYYTKTDQATADKFDQTLPGVEVQDQGPPTNPAMADVYERNAPEGRLTEPRTPDGFTNPLEPINAISNLLSPGWWISEVLEQTIGVNPKDAVAQVVLGDWEAFAKCSNTLNCLAYFNADVRDDVRWNIDALMGNWQGHASQAAQTYFMGLAKALDDHRKAFEGLRDAYYNQAKGAWEFSEAAGDIVQGIFDTIFWMGIEALGGALLSETGVAEVAVWSVAALEAKSIVDDWNQVKGMIDKVQHAAMSAAGYVNEIVSVPGGFGSVRFPAGGYTVPAGMGTP